MDKQQIANLLRIQHASRTDKLVVFIGAGVSQNSGIPTWNNLICSMMEELPSELSKENDVLKLAQMYKDSSLQKRNQRTIPIYLQKGTAQKPLSEENYFYSQNNLSP